jgi:vacuolar-type H+-ATPase subunit I/STV1
MSKQIVTLLYLNGIRDFSKVENYLGVKDGYYEITYDGELRKLKMPGVEYIEIPTKEYIDEKIEELDKNIENLEKNEFIFPNSLDSAIDSVKNQHTTIKTTTIKITEEFDTFEVELQKNEQENENFLKKNKE